MPYPLSLRANGSRDRAPDDRLREAIQYWAQADGWIASSLCSRNDGKDGQCPLGAFFIAASCSGLATP